MNLIFFQLLFLYFKDYEVDAFDNPKLDAKGNVQKVVKLDKSEYRQPEGLCFAKDGTMYMSSEGKGGKGRIYRFDMR